MGGFVVTTADATNLIINGGTATVLAGALIKMWTVMQKKQDESEKRCEEQNKKLQDKIDKLEGNETTLNKALSDIHYKLGFLEGRYAGNGGAKTLKKETEIVEENYISSRD